MFSRGRRGGGGALWDVWRGYPSWISASMGCGTASDLSWAGLSIISFLDCSSCLIPASPFPSHHCPLVLFIQDHRFFSVGSPGNLRSGHRGAYACAGLPPFPVTVDWVAANCCLTFWGQSRCMWGPPHLKQPFRCLVDSSPTLAIEAWSVGSPHPPSP